MRCNLRKRSLPPEKSDTMEPPATMLAVPAGKPIEVEEKPLQSTALPLKSTSAAPVARKKSRAKNVGLQALLDKSRTESAKPAGFGLDLMDFMKT
nr:hypothetical protein B0A51_06579 [Rachicladosporium sp. CCFEE 5018]